ncbi:MAG: hypothetical protein AAFQ91_22790 [Cyanobacteria bacterium J06621_15]
MSSLTITTVIKMIGCLPENTQNYVLEHLREYIQELEEELKWEQSFKKTESNLISAAKLAKQQIAEGLSEAMNYDKL